jgi:hypothetical protein
VEIEWYVPLRPSDTDETGVPAIKKAIVALVGGFGIQANNLWYANLFRMVADDQLFPSPRPSC